MSVYSAAGGDVLPGSAFLLGCRLGVYSHGTLVRGERSYVYPTRLETRTKESNMCASHWVLRNLKAK
jgi:hypothetical protein